LAILERKSGEIGVRRKARQTSAQLLISRVDFTAAHEPGQAGTCSAGRLVGWPGSKAGVSAALEHVEGNLGLLDRLRLLFALQPELLAKNRLCAFNPPAGKLKLLVLQ